MCRLLGVARSSFYAWQSAAEEVTVTAARRARYTELVKKEFTRQRGRAGCRTITGILNSQGHPCSVGFVAAIMRANNLVAVQPRPYRRTTVPGKDPTPATDLIGRDFAPGGVAGSRLVGDITYLRTAEGWVYLATVIDLATRMVIGYALADHMRTTLVTDALDSAIRSGRVHKNAIFHSDKGAQYQCRSVKRRLLGRGARRWVGRRVGGGGRAWSRTGVGCRVCGPGDRHVCVVGG